MKDLTHGKTLLVRLHATAAVGVPHLGIAPCDDAQVQSNYFCNLACNNFRADTWFDFTLPAPEILRTMLHVGP